MTPLRVCLLGNPNAGKTALFNALTGLRQKVANYPGVTVERREGWLEAEGREVHLLDLPGIYSLEAPSPEGQIAVREASGTAGTPPDLLVAVLDATNLERHLYLVAQLRELGRPLMVALNMMDLARARGIVLDVPALARALGVPVLPLSAATGEGIEDLRKALASPPPAPAPLEKRDILARYAWVREVCAQAVDRSGEKPDRLTDRLDRVLTHRVAGLVVFLVLMLLVFMAIFTWAKAPMDAILAAVAWSQGLARHGFEAAGLGGGALEGLAVDGVLQGVGAVLVFLPQILLLFLFIGLLEDSGYMARAAFLMDRIMRAVGLHGRSFIPLMSSFACAIPGIMATRTIEDRRDRLATILVAPWMSCSARLPVYTLMIGALIPATLLWGVVPLQALTVFSMYVLGVAAAFAAAWLFKKTVLKGPPPPFLMEMPPYRLPRIRDVLLNMWDRSRLFLKKAGTVILAVSIVLWCLAAYPKGPMERTFAGRMGHAIEPAIRPLGFDWRIGVGLITSFAAREVLVGTLATLYGMEEGEDLDKSQALQEHIRHDYTPVMAVSLMVFFVLACQCMSTVAVVRRETNSWSWPLFMVAYMTVLAWAASLVTYQVGMRIAGAQA